MHQALPEAGARHEHRLEAVAWMRLLGVMFCWQMVMGNDLLSGFNGTQCVRVETEAFPQGCGLK